MNRCPHCNQPMPINASARTGFRGVPLEMRLLASYEIDKVSGCWNWIGGRRSRRYGQIYAFGRRMSAHRASWMLNRGPIAAGLVVCHRCDNPLCVNPDHLFLGTQADNVADMDSKGRRGRVRGEAVNTAKLTAEQVLEIRALFGRLPHRMIAERFGVTKSQIDKIRSGVCWAHVTADNPESYHPKGADPVAPTPLFDEAA
ncbi:HNH endonuclease signature motif containing protein [Phenylobacterium sp.]|uniref:HNH endonuclease signature motif containing protein n=1 Tax=Phenylobacterium sp. TaxID=1871053 RepID=UPI002FC6D8A5